MNDTATPPTPAEETSARNIATLVYALQALSLLTGGIAYIAAIVVNYVKVEDVRGTLAESHFRWQMRTFWFSVLWLVVGVILAIVGIGFVILGIVCIWVIYRIVKGWLRLNEGKAMYV